ncbi:low affinity immunoglobulin epsilon Fc receptor-like [Saccoglossus kowalevskii]|uniref:Macrophage mannose receptor 1-like n=1 Tax=Saccoglossus kowalevskii TaxID=10224 RepID=A0ABM0MQE1_SACKO|nr:PREDICTED: macrophage mannose receptor 1-like [Saccoglossus kowalevskii]
MKSIIAILAIFCLAVCNGAEVGSVNYQREVSYIFFDDEVDWYQARQNCKNIGGNLATISNQAANDVIVNFLDANGFFGSEDTGVWIGLNDIDQENDFQWVDGSTCSYTNWGNGEPDNNNKQNPAGQDCGQIRTSSMAWDDDYCACIRAKGYICEVEVC